jgi:single-stranded-DNA-specific exonuclease
LASAAAIRPWPACRWTTPGVDADAVRRLAADLSVPATLARCLVARGVSTPGDAAAYLRPRLANCILPDALPGVAQAAEIIGGHIAANGLIVVFGDYDADGMMASAMLAEAIGAIGGRAVIFIPNRSNEGYGFTLPALERCLGEHPATALVVTVDCGISQPESCDLAALRGVAVVVTDHHARLDPLPATVAAVVHPDHPETPAALRHLSGAGVAFKLAHQLARRHLDAESGRALVQRLIPMAAIATVADLVPLVGENRIVVGKGLEMIGLDGNEGCGGNVGLQALKMASSLYGPVSARDIAFGIAPRINASGRVGDPETVLALLRTTDRVEARRLADTLERNNAERRREETQAVEQALADATAQVEDGASAIVVLGDDWHPGVVGLVASRLVGAHGKPAIVATRGAGGVLSASARAPDIPDIDIMKPLAACADWLLKYGGHRAAAGLSLHEENFQAFRDAFDAACADAFADVDFRRVLVVDDWLSPRDATDELETALQRLEPCGMDNPEPLLGIRGLTLRSNPVCFGRIRKDNWEMTFHEIPWRGLLFRHEHFPFVAGDRLDVVFSFSRDLHDELQIIVKDAAKV